MPVKTSLPKIEVTEVSVDITNWSKNISTEVAIVIKTRDQSEHVSSTSDEIKIDL